MHNFKKQLLTGAIILFSIFAQAQSINTYSPYSRYGIGEIPTRGFAATKAMGGVSQAVRSPFGINYLNPASYTSQDTMSFILDFGVSAGTTMYKSQGLSTTYGSGGLHHFAISFPLTKWWGASLGLVPYSQVGYKIKRYETDPVLLSSIGRIRYNQTGGGGLNQVFLGNAFKPYKNLSVGFNLSYYFGSLDHLSEVVFPANKSEYANSFEKNSIVVNDIALSFGAQYTVYLNEKENTYFIFGATLDNETKIKAKRTSLNKWILGSYTDTIRFEDGFVGNIDFPRNISLGASFTYKDKLFTSIEYSTQNWSNAKFIGESDSLTNSQTFRFGVEYTPNRYDIKSYLKRMSYRFGSHYTDIYIMINGYQIKEYGVSFGLCLPFRNNSRFNLSFELGSRGTTNNNLIKETYGQFNLSFSFYDFWFFKRKYD